MNGYFRADVDRLVEAVRYLPAAPDGVQLVDRYRASIAAALAPFGGAPGYDCPHVSPQEQETV